MNEQNPTQQSDANRREFYRIDDDVVLSYRVLGEDELTGKLAEFDEYSPLWASLYASLEGANPEQGVLHDAIAVDSPKLGRYLRILSDKLDLLARIAMSERENLDARPLNRVNLSGSGIGFSVGEPIADDSSLELKISLFPSCLTLLAYGRLIRCEKDSGNPDKPWEVAVRFEAIKEEDREALINHIMKRQAELIRRSEED